MTLELDGQKVFALEYDNGQFPGAGFGGVSPACGKLASLKREVFITETLNTICEGLRTYQ
jgi:hypothetical protein